jgi:hypothetical protein
VRDLLGGGRGDGKMQNLMIVEDPVKGVMVPDLMEFSVESPEKLLQLISMGN